MVRALLLLLAAAAVLPAQNSSSGSLSGRVADPSGAPVPEARVSATERHTQSRATVVTNADGQYRFLNLPGGEYLVEAQSPGLGSSEPKPVRIEAGTPVVQDLSLEIARIATQIQVTAAGVAQTVDEQSKALDIIDAEQFNRRAEITVVEAVRNVPGIRVMQFGGPGSFTRVLTRGTRPADTSVLIDGIRLRDAAAPQGDASSLFSDLMLVNTDRIEVLRGSGSSLYGTHATGGVVNVITDQGGGKFRGDLNLEGGGLGSFRQAAKFSGGTFADRLRFAGGVANWDVFDGVDNDDRARNTTGHGFVGGQLGPSTVLSGRILLADTFTALNDNPYPAPAASLPAGSVIRAVPFVTYTPAPNDPDMERRARTLSGLFGLAHTWGPRLSTRVSYAVVKTDRDTRDGTGGSRFEPMFPDQNIFDGRIDTAQARADFQADRNHLFTAGYEFERENYDNISRDANPDAAMRVDARLRIRQSSNAGFAQLQGRYLDGRLQVLVSGRVQRFALDQPRFSDNNPLYRNLALPSPPDAKTGDVSAAYTIASTNTKIRAHAGNGYRAPSLFERFGASFFFGSFSAYGDPRIAPERVLAFDGGFDQYFAGSRVRVSGTYFYTAIQEQIIFDFSGFIVPDTDPYSRFGGYRNTGGGIARGAEFSIEANPMRSLTLQSSYTHTRALDRRSQYGNEVLRGVRVSDHMFTATASQRIGRAFDLTLDFFAASDFLAPLGGRAFKFDGPAKADIVGSYTRTLSDRHSMKFYTRIENFTNRKYYEEGFPTPRAWAVAGVKWLF